MLWLEKREFKFKAFSGLRGPFTVLRVTGEEELTAAVEEEVPAEVAEEDATGGLFNGFRVKSLGIKGLDWFRVELLSEDILGGRFGGVDGFGGRDQGRFGGPWGAPAPPAGSGAEVNNMPSVEA